jgi:DNA recombination protein RmuC
MVTLASLLLGVLLTWLTLRGTGTRLAAERDRATADLATARSEAVAARQEASAAQQALADAREALAALRATSDAERRAVDEKLALLASSELRLKESFASLAADVLQQNGATFLELAGSRLGEMRAHSNADLDSRKAEVEQLIAPLREGLERLNGVVDGVEKARISAFASLHEQLRAVAEGSTRLQAETQNLTKALRAPQVRGRWGELQLQNVVRLAGMEEHVDFTEQETVTADSGRQRPDLVVKLPGGKTVVVDSKVPLQAYLDALEAPDESARTLALRRHAAQLRTHMEQLSSKAYWDQFAQTPDFVVLFVPGESFLSAACQADPELYERGFSNRVLLVGPATLVAMLKTVAYSWRQEVIAANAERVRDLGQELYDRIGKLADHVEKVGKGLRTAVEGYNSAVGTLESRVLVSARKFKELGVDSPRDIPLVEPLDLTPRALQAPEFERALPASTVAAASDSPTHLSRGAPADAPALPPASG